MVSATVYHDAKKLSENLIQIPVETDVPQKKLKKTRFFIPYAENAVILAVILIFILFSSCALRRMGEQKRATERYEVLFDEFLYKFNRLYSSQEEYKYRYHIFVHNVREFEEEERRHPGLDLDINEFTDWSEEELRKMIVDKKNVKEEKNAVRFEGSVLSSGVKRPASIDWRDQGKLTPIKNQGQCGSCWAFATVAAIEAQHAIKKGNLVSLSEQEMVDCDGRNNGCSGGYRPYAMRFVKENGLETEKSYPYSALKHDQCMLHQNDTKVYIDDYRMLSTSEEDIADWVGTKGPVTFGMNVVKAMYSYRSGIFNPSAEDCAEKSMGAHALTIVGYGGEGESAYWIVKNSWGTSWGSDGYFRLARGVNSCGLANTVVAPIIN
ncbi:unnamed protein product [Caenorhabditis nigoni]